MELSIQGPEPDQQLRLTLDRGRAYRVGRAAGVDVCIPWEGALSRVHASIELSDADIAVLRAPEARNPIYLEGHPTDEFDLSEGGQFVIGQTVFRVSDTNGHVTPDSDRPLEQLTFTRGQLQQVRFVDADRRIEVLSRLPDVISGPGTTDERDSRLVGLVLAGIRHADVVALVELDPDDTERTVVRHWERRQETAGAFRPSTRLIVEALRRSGDTVLHFWSGSESVPTTYTAFAGVDWAFCTPVGIYEGRRWGIYVAGRMEGTNVAAGGAQSTLGPRLEADVRFTELVAEIINSVLRMGNLEGNLAVLRQFLAPPIIAALERTSGDGTLDAKLLEPRECAVTVLFCDLRGFSQRMEGSAHDLTGLLERVSAALEIMTHCVTECGGVTGDFLGDATLGFWGWPFASEEAPLNACRAALAIRREFVQLRQEPDHPLADFEMGIGIAHGRAVAGKIGTADRVTVTVFGPVVNLASRLEGLTKQLHVPVLLDESTAEIVRERLSETEGRIRRLARILPYGMETPLMVSELLPPASEFAELADTHLRRFEEGVDQFIAGRWEEAYRCLHEMPSSDRAQDFLTLRIAQHNRRAPADWDGIVRMPSK